MMMMMMTTTNTCRAPVRLRVVLSPSSRPLGRPQPPFPERTTMEERGWPVRNWACAAALCESQSTNKNSRNELGALCCIIAFPSSLPFTDPQSPKTQSTHLLSLPRAGGVV